MSPELEKNLINNFYRLFQDKDEDLKKTMIGYGCCCDDGWYNLIYDTLTILDKFPIKLFQIKEKFGSLVIYWEFEEKDFNDDILTDKIENILEQVSEQSVKICEICGESGSLCIKNHWFKTLCYKHRKDDIKWHSTEAAEYYDRKVFYEKLGEEEEY